MSDIRFEKIHLRFQLSLIYEVWRRNATQFTKTWMTSLLWIVLEPLCILIAIGYGVGSYISTIEGLSYVEFFFPALMCSSAMFVAYYTCAYDGFNKMNHQNLYQLQILSPLEPQEIVIGEVLWAATKGTLSALGICLFAAFFGLLDTWLILPALLVIFIVAAVFASFGMLMATYVRSSEQLLYPTSCVIVPLSFLSGTYFPLQPLPVLLKLLAYVSPLTHGVRVVRHLLNHYETDFDLWAPINLAYLIVIGIFLIRWSSIRLTDKLFR